MSGRLHAKGGGEEEEEEGWATCEAKRGREVERGREGVRAVRRRRVEVRESMIGELA